MTTVEEEMRIPEKIFRNSLPLVAKALRGEAPTGPWAPYVEGIQLGINEAYQIVGYWPRPVVVDSPFFETRKILKLAQERPFTHQQALKFLASVNSVFHKLELWDEANKDYWVNG